jgi:DDE family transposase
VRQRRDLLVAPQGLAEGWRVKPAASRSARRARQGGPDRLVASLPRLGQRCRQKGGEETDPNPVDRGCPGTKRHLVTDAGGVPLAVELTGANVHDSKVLAELVDSIVPV